MDILTLSLVDGTRICLPPSVNRLTTYVVLEQEDWFEDEIRFVRRFVDRGMKAVDIGANFGVYTLALARCVGPRGRVWSFEPTSLPLGFLRRSIDANAFDHVEIFDLALSSFDGTAEMGVSDNSELNRLAPGPGEARETVTVSRLDSVAEMRSISEIDFVKLDAEGEEESILEGGRSFFECNTPLAMFEIKRDGELNWSLVEKFATAGYRSYRLIPGLAILAPLDETDPLDPFQLNLFCCKQDRASVLEAAGTLVSAIDDRFEPSRDPAELWQTYLTRQPLARKLMPHWTRSGGGGPSVGRRRHEFALAAYAMAHDDRLSSATRVRALRFCVKELHDLVRDEPSFPRLCSLARSAGELGARHVCVVTLRQALGLVRRGEVEMDEPFLPVNERFDSIDPAERIGDWIVVGLVERLERAASHSSYFCGTENLELLANLRGRSFHSPQLERRWQLMRLRAGLQAAPEPVPIVATHSPANLNAEFWSRDTR